MGFKLAEWAMNLEEVKGWTKAVLVVTAAKADDRTSQCFPSQKTLAAACGASLATVNRSLDQLESTGILTRSRRSTSAGYRTSDLITLNPAWIAGSQVGAEPTRQTANLADSKSLDVTVKTPTYQGDRAEEDHSDDHSVGHSDLMLIEVDDSGVDLRATPARTFAEFWMVWPRSEGKKAAEKAWNAAVKRANANTIYDAAVAFATSPWKPARQFTKHAATWLNGDCWNDPLPQPPEADRSRLSRGERDLAFVQQLAAREAAQTRGITS